VGLARATNGATLSVLEQFLVSFPMLHIQLQLQLQQHEFVYATCSM